VGSLRIAVYFNKQAGLPCAESIVFKDENVLAMLDIAPFVKGHYLVITEKHFLSFRDVDLETFNSAMSAKEHLINSSVLNNNRVLILEHGTGSTGDGMCIDHAHIHILPISYDVEVADIDNFIVSKTNTSEKN
jgi:diadenosine tetraphosphate (Ap4A) HIT family hydrolase